MVLGLQMPEEEAFCVFVRLMQEYRLRELFKPSMAELGLCIYQFEYLLQVGTPQSPQGGDRDRDREVTALGRNRFLCGARVQQHDPGDIREGSGDQVWFIEGDVSESPRVSPRYPGDISESPEVSPRYVGT